MEPKTIIGIVLVVFIVGAWQALDKPAVKQADNKLLLILVFMATLAVSVFFSLSIGILFLFIICLIKESIRINIKTTQ